MSKPASIAYIFLKLGKMLLCWAYPIQADYLLPFRTRNRFYFILLYSEHIFLSADLIFIWFGQSYRLSSPDEGTRFYSRLLCELDDDISFTFKHRHP